MTVLVVCLSVCALTSWLEVGPGAMRASKWSLWMRAHMETVSVGGWAGGGAPHSGWMKPRNCRATSISVVGVRLMVVLRRMATWGRAGGWGEGWGRDGWEHINRGTIHYRASRYIN